MPRAILLTGAPLLAALGALAYFAAPYLVPGLSGFTALQWVSILAIVLAVGFDFVNGFHDTANACATIVYSGVLRPWVAIGMSATLNFLGAALVGTTVALFVTGVIPLAAVTLPVLLSVLLSGLIWNVVTWYKGLPVSSTHCLIGSLVGGGIASAGLSGVTWGAFEKTLIGLAISPVIGFIVAFAVAWVLNRIIPDEVDANGTIKSRTKLLSVLQVISSASVSFSHGANDGQKTMGVITLILATQFASLGFTTHHVPFWVVALAASAIGLGTAIGGKRVMETVGRKLSHKAMNSKHGSAAEMTTAATVFTASWLGVPVSTTHVLTSGVVGSTMAMHGAAACNVSTLKSIGLAWLLTLPATAALAWALFQVISRLF
jgi:PiT family inorganic phosphate transporter